MNEEFAQDLIANIESTIRILRVYEISDTSRNQNELSKRLSDFVTCFDEKTNLSDLEMSSQVDFFLHEN